MREAVVRSADGTHRIHSRVNQFSCFTLAGGYHAGAIRHLAVSEGWAVFHDQNPLSADQFGRSDRDLAGGL